MLSQNSTTIQQRQRQHRRQQSTPNVFDPAQVQPFQRQSSHRRGISLDQRQRRQSPQQEYMINNTNNGFNQDTQHILRETQQQRLVRPGSQPQAFDTYDNDENFRANSLVTIHRQDVDTGCGYDVTRQAQASYAYPGQVNTSIKVDPMAFDAFVAQDSTLFASGSLTPSAYLDFPVGYEEASEQSWTSTIKSSSRPSSSRRISGGIAGRVAQFEGMAAQQPASRPITPPTQNSKDYFPLTPASTPFDRNRQSQAMPQRFQEGYDASMEDTVKPRRNQRSQNVFEEMREQMEMQRPPSPPGTAPMVSTAQFDSVKMPTSSEIPSISKFPMGSLKSEHAYESSYYSPAQNHLTPDMSQHSTPEMSQASLYSSTYEQSQFGDNGMQMSPGHSEQSRRSQSVDSLILEETITETGITIDDIAHYISGPDDAQKWLCLFPSCGKKFGRKENIKSHVQTHLGDRQYQCPHCKKCFVRQHDLKRHAKIHSGVKPYPCACGNSFARHDALTRHRQRGMCIGAFEGVVKKVVKRGRPRKHRPDDEERLEKSSRTRSKNKASASQASSASEYSESSYGRSPTSELDILDEDPFQAYTPQDYSQEPTTMENATHILSYLPATGAQANSPSAHSVHSQDTYRSPASEHEHYVEQHYRTHSAVSIPDFENGQLQLQLPAHPSNTMKTDHAQYSPAPGLSLSSSSPSTQRFYDIPDVASTSDLGIGKLDLQVAGDGMSMDMYLEQFGAGDDNLMATFDGSKFDDAFAVSDMNMNNHALGLDMLDDVFFGSP